MLSQLIWPLKKSEKDGTPTITAKNSSLLYYKEVKIPFWSHANGMKDIIWYTPTPPGRWFIYCNSQSKRSRKCWWQIRSAGLLVMPKVKTNLWKGPLSITQLLSHLLIWSLQNQKRGTFTITAKNLQGLMATRKWRFHSGLMPMDERYHLVHANARQTVHIL